MVESSQRDSSQKGSAHDNGWGDFPIPIIEGLDGESLTTDGSDKETFTQEHCETYPPQKDGVKSEGRQEGESTSQKEVVDRQERQHDSVEFKTDQSHRSEKDRSQYSHAEEEKVDSPVATPLLTTENDEHLSPTEPSQLDPIVHLVNAEVARGDNPILSDVTLTIFPGDFIYLVGKVGSGKSTLIETLTGQIPLIKGEGLVCGFDLMRLRNRQIPKLRRSIGVVFQDFKLLTDRNVEKNLIFVLRATGWRDKHKIARRIEEVLTQVGLAHKAYKMPNQLSGGEQQRIAIARAILNNPTLILADEPTGNLDPETSEGILFILKGLAESGRSVVMATHNRHLANQYPAPTLRCAHGRLEEISQTRYYEPS